MWVQGREFMKGPFQVNTKTEISVIYSVPYSIQLYVLCPFITWKKTFVTAVYRMYTIKQVQAQRFRFLTFF